MENAIGLLDKLNYVQGTAHILLAYFSIDAFIPLRKHWFPRLLALLVLWQIVPLPVYLDDPWNIRWLCWGLVYPYLYFIRGNGRKNWQPYSYSTP